MSQLQILESSSNNVRFKERGKHGGEAISRVGFGDDIFRVGLHGMKVKWGRREGKRLGGYLVTPCPDEVHNTCNCRGAYVH